MTEKDYSSKLAEVLAEVVRQLMAERDKAVELNDWYRKRCNWYQQELDAQSRAETAGSLRDMRRAEAAEQKCDALEQDRERWRQAAVAYLRRAEAAEQVLAQLRSLIADTLDKALAGGKG